MRFLVFGPFEVPRRSARLVARAPKPKQDFWDSVDLERDGLSEACGCYVFAIRRRPWYVGLAERRSFRKECFSASKIVKYDGALSRVQGRPELYFLAKVTPRTRFARRRRKGHRDIRTLEKLLIGMALARNPRLENIGGTKFLREMNVPGILNSRKGQARAIAVQKLRAILDLQRT